MRCEGFTRPACEPCPETEDLEKIKYDSLGILEKKTLCPLCRSRLLNPESTAWNLDEV